MDIITGVTSKWEENVINLSAHVRGLNKDDNVAICKNCGHGKQYHGYNFGCNHLYLGYGYCPCKGFVQK